MRVLVTADYRTLSETSAELVAKALGARSHLTLGLPTGNTPLGMYAELVRRYRDERLDFSHVQTFNLDEYLGLPADHPQRYHSYMQRHFFDYINIAADHI